MAWYANWAHRRLITVVETGGGEYNNYPTPIPIAYQVGMKSDFSDCRWTDIDGETLIDYGIISKVDSDNCKFVLLLSWVAYETKYLYVYYGKPDASSTAIDYSSWVESWYQNNRAGNISIPYVDAACDTFTTTFASGNIPSWAGHVYGGLAIDGAAYSAYFGRVWVNSGAYSWDTGQCIGASPEYEEYLKYQVNSAQTDAIDWVKGEINTVMGDHYEGGDPGYFFAWQAAEPFVTLGDEENMPEPEGLMVLKFIG